MQKGVAAATPFLAAVKLRLLLRRRLRLRSLSRHHLYGHAVLKAEGERRFRTDNDLLVAGIRSCRRAATAADESADERAFAAAGQTADERASAGAAADKACGALALTFEGAGPGAGDNRRARSVDPQARQPQRKNAAPLNLPRELAEITVPLAVEPVVTSVLPFTMIGEVTVASKASPACAVFELMVCASRTVMRVPAGMV